MKKINVEYDKYTFEDIKHIDDYGNEYWFARELSKVLEYRDWRNFVKVLNKAEYACRNSGFNVVNNLLRSTSCQKEIIMLLLIYKIINYQGICVI